MNRLKETIYQEALGRTLAEQIIVEEGGKRKITRVKKEVPPNLDAAKFLLTNLDPKNWKLKPEAPSGPPLEGELKTLLHQISEMRSAHIQPVPLRPGEEKHCE